MKKAITKTGTIVDIEHRRLFHGTITVQNSHITKIVEDGKTGGPYILPGFIDSHIHIESTMLPPRECSRIASIHGTVGLVADPHEIANVLGMHGMRYMIREAKKAAIGIFFAAPSCVPATPFETAGGEITTKNIETLCQNPSVVALGEMMNYHGVINHDPIVLAKIRSALLYGKPVDGHAPHVTGTNLTTYCHAGITTDHECETIAEAQEKLRHGMHILIREGSAAKNFDSLSPLFLTQKDHLMFASDDKHPDALQNGHINELVSAAVRRGYDLFRVLRAACITPINHYHLPIGTIQIGNPADFIVVKDLHSFHVLETWYHGRCVARNGTSLLPYKKSPTPNMWHPRNVTEQDFLLKPDKPCVRVIGVTDGSLITKNEHYPVQTKNGFLASDPKNNILFLTVINRYQKKKPAIAMVRGCGNLHGAIATSVAHDSHNIIAVGDSPKTLTRAINTVIRIHGGMAVVDEKKVRGFLPLPIAGLMSALSYQKTAHVYKTIETEAKKIGSTLASPFMTLSFLALLVIPELKLSDKGLFDGTTFSFTNLFIPDYQDAPSPEE